MNGLHGWATVTGLLKEIRPRQWYKQSLLLLGIVFAGQVGSATAWVNVGLGIISFTAVASAVYIFNDISDIEADRQHPVKRHRPIASGQVGVPTGVAFGLALLAGGLLLASTLGVQFSLVVGTYLVQNVLYSTVLKEIAIVDVLLVAIGFVLRAIAGVVVIQVALSPWLVVCTFLAALVLAIGKRRQELAEAATPARTRAALAAYTAQDLREMHVVVTAALAIAYALYTFFRTTDLMMITIPFAFYALFRHNMLVNRSGRRIRPVDLLQDGPFVANLACWIGLVLVILYDAFGPLVTPLQ